MGTVLNITKPEFTPQDHKDIRSEVVRFESLYKERYGALTPAQRANLTQAIRHSCGLGIGVENSAEALMAWGVYTGSIHDMLEDRVLMERLLFDYDGDHKDLDECVREIYSRYFHVDDAQALRFVDTKAFKDELEYWGWCFAPSLDGTVFFAFND